MTDHSKTEVCIIGAGPAGAATAIRIAAAGRSVVLLDKSRFPRDKTCGDGLTSKALRDLSRLGLVPSTLASWHEVHRTVLHPPGARAVILPFPDGGRPYAGIVRRAELDAALTAIARGAGVELRDAHEATRLEEVASGVRVHLDNGDRIEARYAVVATGASPKELEDRSPQDEDREELFATRLYLEGSHLPRHEAHVWFLPETIPGYAWLFPLAGASANLGVAIPRAGADIAAATRLTRALAGDGTVADVIGDTTATDRLRAWRIPVGVAAPSSHGRVLRVGDAAGTGDPLTGEGIGQAIESGMLAAGAILAGGHDPGAAHRRAVASALRRDHRASRLARRILSRPRGVRLALRALALRPAFAARWMWEDVPRGVLLSPSAILSHRRGAGSGDGDTDGDGAGDGANDAS